MERTGGPERERQYVTEITLAISAERIEDLTDKVDHVRNCANEQGFSVLDASTGLTREREPAETFHWGSDKPWRNNNRLHEMTELGMEVATPAGAGL